MNAPRAEFRGEAVLAGLGPDEKAYARGFTAGHDDARDGMGMDHLALLEAGWYVAVYRAGYEAAQTWG